MKKRKEEGEETGKKGKKHRREKLEKKPKKSDPSKISTATPLPSSSIGTPSPHQNIIPATLSINPAQSNLISFQNFYLNQLRIQSELLSKNPIFASIPIPSPNFPASAFQSYASSNNNNNNNNINNINSNSNSSNNIILASNPPPPSSSKPKIASIQDGFYLVQNEIKVERLNLPIIPNGTSFLFNFENPLPAPSPSSSTSSTNINPNEKRKEMVLLYISIPDYSVRDSLELIREDLFINNQNINQSMVCSYFFRGC